MEHENNQTSQSDSQKGATQVQQTPDLVLVHSDNKGRVVDMLIGMIVLCVIALGGIGFGVYGMNRPSDNSENAGLVKQAEDNNEIDQAAENKQESSPQISTREDGKQTETDSRYISPENWSVQFKMPENVVSVLWDENKVNYDGEIIIDGIATNEKAYGVEICGGADAYRHYPFFLGTIIRWNPSATHESWENSPAKYDGELIYTDDTYEYYYGRDNGCETGDNNENYQHAVSLVKELLTSIGN